MATESVAGDVTEVRRHAPSLRDYVAFLGFRSHSIYWGRRYESEATVFTLVVEQLYAGEPLLA